MAGGTHDDNDDVVLKFKFCFLQEEITSLLLLDNVCDYPRQTGFIIYTFDETKNTQIRRLSLMKSLAI